MFPEGSPQDIEVQETSQSFAQFLVGFISAFPCYLISLPTFLTLVICYRCLMQQSYILMVAPKSPDNANSSARGLLDCVVHFVRAWHLCRL